MAETRPSDSSASALERALHDETIQALYGVCLQLENCIHLIEESSESAKSELDAAITKVNAVIGEVRSRIYQLSRLSSQRGASSGPN
jgi:signal transduction histidine kinase